MRTSKSALSFALLALACLALVPAIATAAANIVIINTDGAGEGFNDPTPAAPVGGNPGTTIGEQRLNAFQYAASVWGATLDSNVTIRIQAAFNPLTCTATGAVLGSAGAIEAFGNAPPAPPWPGLEVNTWYGSALTNKRVGYDISPGQNDINAQFNSNLGLPGCLTGIFWYYGFDNNHGGNIDLVTVLLHEFGHGLNFQQFANVSNGILLGGSGANPEGGFPDVFNKRILDTTSGKTWNQMTRTERVASAINNRKVVWNGPTVTAAVPTVLSPGTPLVRFIFPPTLAPDAVGLAQFGPALTSTGINRDVVQALPTDACSPLTNAPSITGRIALVDRGTCGFTIKVKNAQDAGAEAVIVADNAAGAPPAGLAGVDATITIPSVRITQADGNALKAALANNGFVNARILNDQTIRQGTDLVGGTRALLYTPNPVAPGSTISHWDTTTFPNQLMEPNINLDLTHSVTTPEDMTLALLRDVGWFPDSNLNGVPDGNELTALSPAEIWLGVKNSDDVGTNFDLKVDILKNGSVIGSGQSLNVPGGSSGFNNAVQRSVNLAITAPGTTFSTGDELSIKIYARIGATGHRSGTARLWFNDGAADTEFDTTIGGVNQDWYIRFGGGLETTPGAGAKKSIDLTLDRLVGGNPYKLFGSWSHTF